MYYFADLIMCIMFYFVGKIRFFSNGIKLEAVLGVGLHFQYGSFTAQRWGCKQLLLQLGVHCIGLITLTPHHAKELPDYCPPQFVEK